MEKNHKLLAEGKFEYDRMGISIAIAVILTLLGIVSLIVGLTGGSSTSVKIACIGWFIMFTGIGIISLVSRINEKNQVLSRSLKIYDDEIIYVSGGKSGSFQMKVSELNSVEINKGKVVLNMDRSKTITFCKNAVEINDVLQALRNGKPVESKEEKATKQVVVNNARSNADEIRKYKALLDEGIISEEEFEAKKNALLNG